MFKTNKKLYSFILFAFLISCWSSTAQTVIFQENFETTPISLNSTSTGTGTWALNTRLHAEGLQCDSVTINTGDTTYLSSNSFSTVGKSIIYLDFKHIAKVEYFDACEIEVSNNGGTSWTKLTTTEYKGTGLFLNNKFTAAAYSLWMATTNTAVPQNSWWKHERFDISTLVANAASVKIRFVITDKNNNGSQMNAGWFIDDIKISEINCPAPTNQLTSNITDTSVVMAWTEKGTATQWDIEYGSSGFNLGTGTRITVSSNPDTLIGLTSHTNYDWYVRARCSANDSSYWLGPNSFVTLVGAHVLPLHENFESGLAYFDNKTGNNVNFIDETTLYHSGTHSVKNHYGSNNNNFLEETNVIDLSATTNAVLLFWHIAKTEGGFDKCFVEISTDGGVTYTALPNSTYRGSSLDYATKGYFHEDSYTDWGTGSQTPSNTWWRCEKFDLSNYANANVKFRFKLTTDGSGQRAGWYIDDIKIYEPTCPEPNNLTSLVITNSSVSVDLVENGTANQWQIEYDTAGTIFGNGNRKFITTHPDTLTGLYTNKAYNWYARAICGANDSSTWRGPNTFNTSCTAITTFPWSEGFENLPSTGNGIIPTCMEEFGDWASHSGSTTYNRAPHNGSKYIYTNYSSDDWLISPGFQLVAGTHYDFSFYYITDGRNGWTTLETKIGNYQIKDSLKTTIGTPLSNIKNTTYQKYEVTFTPNTSGVYYIGVHVVASTSPWYISFDDFKLDVSPTCPHPSNQGILSVTYNSASVDLVENGTANQWQIEYDTAGTTFGNGNRKFITSHPDTLTGLYSNKSYNWYARAICGANDSSTWIGPHTFSTTCAPITTFPWNEGFENLSSTGNGIIPSCMYEFGDWASCSGSISYNRAPHNGSKYIHTKYFADDWLISPEFQLVAGTHYDFSFYYITDGRNGWTTLETKIGNYQIKDSLKTAIGTSLTNIKNTTYQKYEVTFTPTTSGSYYIGVHVVANFTPMYISFDDFKLDLSPPCPHPSNQSILSVTSNSAIVNWLENGNATQWDIEYDTAGFTFGTGNRLNAVSKPDTLEPLVNGQSYEWYVRSTCGPNDTSTWFGPHNFNFINTIHTLPIYDDFENGFSYFDNKPNNNTDFIDATNLFHSGSHSIRNNYDDNNSNVFEETGIIDLSSTSNAILEFWHIAKTEGNLDLCFVEISTDAGNTYTPLPNSTYLGASTDYSSRGYFHEDSYSTWGTGNQTPTNTWWKFEEFSLSGYNVSNVRIRFRLTTDGSSQRAGWYIDDIKIFEPTCPKPNNPNSIVLSATSAVLSWTENGSATQWEIEYNTTNFVQGTGTIVATNTNPDTITGLSPNTTYDWYVRASCSANDTSDWSNFVSSFSTPCQIITNLPWTEDFENMISTGNGIIPPCAKEKGDWGTNSSPASYNRKAHLGSKYLFTKYSANDWYFSPSFQLTAGISYDYSFYYATDGKNGWTKIETKIGSMQLKDSMITAIGTPILGPNNTTYQQYRATFTVNTSGYYNIGLHIVATSNPWYITFDDFMLEETPTCPQPTNLSLINVSTDSAIISWAEVGSATQWDVEYGLRGYALGSGTIIHTTHKPDTITPLLSGTDYDYYVRARCSATDSSHWSGSFGFTTDCSIITSLPWTEDFENMINVGNGIIPNCLLENGDWETSKTNLSYNRKSLMGTNFIYTKDIADDWFISPEFYLTAGTSYDYSFYYITDGKSGWDTLETKIGHFQHKDSMMVSIGSAITGANNTTYKEYRATFSPTVSGSYYIGVHVKASSTPDYISFDNFKLEETPTCPHPTQLISTILPNRAIINWTEVGSATQWEYEYDTTGFSLGTGTRISTNSKPDTISSTAAGKYDLYVRSLCSATDSSIWTLLSSFKVIFGHNFPLTEDFENGFTYFDNKSGNTVDFIDETSIVHSGGHSVKNNYSKNNENILLETGIMDLSNTNHPIIEFWHIAKTEGGFDKCYIEISTDGGATFTALPNSVYHGKSANYASKGYFHEDSYSEWGTSNSQTPDSTWWKQEMFDINNYKTTSVMFRFRIKTDGSSNRSGWYIDDIYIHEQQQYDIDVIKITKPISLYASINSTIDTVSLLITNNGYDTIFPNSTASVNYEYDHQNPKTIVIMDTIFPYKKTIVKINQPFTVLVGDKELKVYSSFSFDNNHANDTIVKIVKGIGVHSFPLTEDFENGFTYFDNKSGNTVDFIDETSIIHGGGHCAKNNYSNNNENILLETGIMDLSNTNHPIIEFWHIAKTEGEYDKCYIEISTDGGATFTALPNSVYHGKSTNYSSKGYFHEDSYSEWGTSGSQTPNNAWWKREVFDISNYKTTSVMFRFRIKADGSNIRSGWYIDDIYIHEQQQYDIDVIKIIKPISLYATVNSTIDTVSLLITNNGYDTIFPNSTASVNYEYDHQNPKTIVIMDTIFPYKKTIVKINQPFTVLVGDKELKVYSSFSSDNNHANDTIVKSFRGIGTETLNFTDSFDVSNSFFAASNSCWQKGDPEGTHIDTAHSSPNAWMTNLNNGYPNNTESYLYTPFFDFSSVLPTDSAVLSFYHWIDALINDGGYIQYTKNNGTTWLSLGYKGIGSNKATNWYNKTKSGKHFWNALNTGWQKSDIKLPFHGATPIQFRFVFFSNATLNTKDGWAIDDFKITLPLKPKDVGITAITTPSGSVQLGSNVNVIATIKNYGTASQTSFPVKYTINGSNPVTQTFTASGTGLASNTTQPFTFNTAFSAPAQNFKLCVYTDLSNDAYAHNDTICTMISTTPAALDAGVISIVANPHWNDTTKSSFDNSVSIQIVNFGINTLTSIPLEYKVGTTVKANETWTGTLASTDTVSYTFTATYKSSIGHYNLCASTKLQNDANASNNSKCHNYLGIIDANIDYADGYKFSVNQNEPNPATDKARIDLIIPKNGKLIFALRNSLGQLITEKIYNFSVGNNSIIFDVHNLPSGVYYYTVTYRNNKITKQMIVK